MVRVTGQGPAAKNGNIRSFFKPADKSQLPSKPDPVSRSGSVAPSSPSTPKAPVEAKSPFPFSSPAPLNLSPSPAPRKQTASALRAPISRDVIIGDSDDDGDDSDSSLEEIGTFLTGKYSSTAAPVPRKENADGCVTPKPKRFAPSQTFSFSPLTPQQQKPEFNMTMLLNEARQTDNIIAGFRKPSTKLGKEQLSGDELDAASDSDVAMDMICQVSGEERAAKARKALERTGTGPARKRWYFFEARQSATPPGRPPFPKEAATGPWALLAHNAKRQHVLLSGMHQTMLAKGHQLPDELFAWMLDAATRENVTAMRQEWTNILRFCPDQVQRLVTPDLVDRTLEGLGATKDIDEGSESLHLVPEQPTRYDKHDWGRVVSWLEFVAAVSPNLSQDTVARILHHLLRMAVDPVVVTNLKINTAHGEAVTRLCEVVHRSRWDGMCAELCRLLQVAFPQPSLRAAPLLALPSTSALTHDLRRRLATSFLLDDPSLAARHPDDTIKLEVIRSRLDGEEFVVRKGTDYVEMRALVLLLNLAVDDGSFDRADEEAAFNAQIDGIANRLKEIWRSIIDTGGAYTSRTDVKNALEWVEQRLTYAVRTRRHPKQDIFDLAAAERDDTSLIRQQAYMKQFFAKPTVSADATADLADTDSIS